MSCRSQESNPEPRTIHSAVNVCTYNANPSVNVNDRELIGGLEDK